MKLQNKLRSGGKLSPQHKSPNFRRKLSNGHEGADNVVKDLMMSRSQTGFEYRSEEKERT